MFTLLAVVTTMALADHNVLTPKETKDGWKLLFDGKTTKGWHNFKSNTIQSGWTTADGTLSITDPSKAGDIVSDEKFSSFEMKIDYRMSKGGNSGVMFHVEDAGDATWHSGPEFQLLDNPAFTNAQQAGWLYDLYSSKVDATKPAGEWNTLRIMISKKECFSEMNGVRYVTFNLGSDDFKARVAKSKLSGYVHFGNLGSGSIAIQGDHGVVSFRNIKIRPIKD